MLRLKEALSTASWTAEKQTTSKGRAKTLKFQRLSNEASAIPDSPSPDKLKVGKSVLPLTISFDDLDDHDCVPGDVMGRARKTTLSRKPTLSPVEKHELHGDTSASTDVILFVSSARSKPKFGTAFSFSKDDDQDDGNVCF